MQLWRLSYIFLGCIVGSLIFISLLVFFIAAVEAQLLSRWNAFHGFVGCTWAQQLLLEEELVNLVHEVSMQLLAPFFAFRRCLRILNALIGHAPARELAPRALLWNRGQRTLGPFYFQLHFVQCFLHLLLFLSRPLDLCCGSTYRYVFDLYWYINVFSISAEYPYNCSLDS